MTAINSNSTDLSSMNSVYNLKQKKIEPTEIEKMAPDKKEINNIKESNVKTNFSYDDKTKEMIIQVEKNGSTFQYPSEDLLRLKKYLMEESSEPKL